MRGAAPFALPQSVHHGVRTGAIIGAAAVGGLAAFGVLTMRREARVGAALLVSGALPALATLAFVDARVSAGALAWSAVPLSATLPAAIFWAWGTGVAARSRPSRDD